MVNEEVQQKVLEFLKNNKVAVISTVTQDNKPSSATIYYIVEENFDLYFMTKANSRKDKNLNDNQNVSLVIGTENIPVTVQIQGTAIKIVDRDDIMAKTTQLTKMFSTNNFIPPLFKLEPDYITIYKITPSWMRWLDFRNSQNEFLQIIP